MYIDLTAPGMVEAEVWALRMSGHIVSGGSMKDVVGEITLVTGRMFAPPAWSQQVIELLSY
jgi:alpha-glucosidase (family GH31 glycosyl hydrolase)